MLPPPRFNVLDRRDETEAIDFLAAVPDHASFDAGPTPADGQVQFGMVRSTSGQEQGS